MKKALAKAYQHPWWKLESQVKFIYEREEFKEKIKASGVANKQKTNVSRTESHRQHSDGDIYSDRNSQRSRDENKEVKNIDYIVKLRQSAIMTPRESL